MNRISIHSPRAPRVPVLLVSALLAGCASIGPASVPDDQFEYNAAIAESLGEQLLVNLVRLRYSETPVFLTVSSMISQYSRVASVNAGVGANTAFTGDDTATAGGSFVWTDRPTITYTPLKGREFSQNLLQPLPPRELFELLMAGWHIDLIMRVSLRSLNHLDNAIARPASRRQADPGMVELVEVWERLREAGLLGLRQEGEEESGRVTLFLREELPAEERTEAERVQLEEDLRQFRELLDLDPAASRFSMTYGRVPETDDEIAVLTGSVWDIMLNLAWQFEVPEEHVASGRTRETFYPETDEPAQLIDIRFSDERPEDPFVAVRAQGYWWYINQDDGRSKRVFSFLQLLLNLSESAMPDRSPLITISR